VTADGLLTSFEPMALEALLGSGWTVTVTLLTAQGTAADTASETVDAETL
jgi:hypothetical protein